MNETESDSKVQEIFHRKLFSLLLTLPDDITTLEDAAAWRLARGAGLIMQEVTRDTADLQQNIMLALITKEKAELVDLYPGTSQLMKRLLPYLNAHNMGFDELSQSLVNPDTFEKICDEAAGENPELQKVAESMKKLMKLTKQEMDDATSEENHDEEEFTEEY